MKVHRFFAVFIGIALLLQACGNGAAVTPSPTAPVTTNGFFSPIPFRSGVGFRGPWLELYFTDPSSPLAEHEIGGVEEFISNSIVQAKESVDVALRNLTLEGVTKALVLAHQRGVAVRVVTETDSLDNRSKILVLKSAGIPVIDDQQEGTMDNKFIVIDHNQVWTGSMNYSPTGVFREDAALVRIFSPEVAQDFTREFDEMFVNRQFGPLVVPDTPNPGVTIQGTQIEVLFSPDDLVSDRLVQLLKEAHESIYFLAYAFTSPELGDIIRKRAAEGIKVSGVLAFNLSNPDETNPAQIEQMDLFQKAKLDIRRHSGPEGMNHKFIVIDGKIVVMGSYDFITRSEVKNDENVLIFHNEDIAQKFLAEFQRVYSLAQPQ